MRELLALCGENPIHRKVVLVAYGETLLDRSMNEDAGVVFVAAGELERAVAAYRAAGAWRMALALAGEISNFQI